MEEVKSDILKTIDNFSSYFGRNYKENNFFSGDSNCNFANFTDLDKIWDIEIIDPKTPYQINQDKLIDINNKIYTYYDYLLKKYNYSSKNREEFDEMIQKIFLLLSNIYDLFPNYIEIYFKNAWLKLHFKLLDACLDINNIPKPGLDSSENNKIKILSKFSLFFSLCLSNDANFDTRLFLFENHSDLFYKIAIIASNTSWFCCCGHGMTFDNTDYCSNIRAILLVFETFKYFEENNINYYASKKVKIQILEYLFPRIAKNPCIVFLYKMAKMLNNDWMFEHISITTHLFKDAFEKENDANFTHAIDGFEELIILCSDRDLLFYMLNIINPPEKGLKNRIFREILKKIFVIVNGNDAIEYLENKLYNNALFQKVLETLKRDVYLGDYEGIWQILLDSNNDNIVNIFFRMKNKYNFGDIMFKQVDSLIKNYLTGKRLNGVVRIINLFLKLGVKIVNSYLSENYYLEQFRDCYKKICELRDNEDDDITEFKNYYQNN